MPCTYKTCANNVDAWKWIGTMNSKTDLQTWHMDGTTTLMVVDNLPLGKCIKIAGILVNYRWTDADCSATNQIICEFDYTSLSPESK